MRKNHILVKFVTVVLLLSLVFVGMPSGHVAAKPVPRLTVDVWTDKGGQGTNMPGGQYQLGERPTIFFKVSIGCQTRVTLTSPGGTNSWQQQAMHGLIYEKPIGYAEEVDIGQWQVVIEAKTTTGDQTASDTTWFNIVGPPIPAPSPLPPSPPTVVPPAPEPAPTPEPEPAPTPDLTSQPPSTKAEIIASKGAIRITELDALRALKMADGSLSADLTLDADGDKKVTRKDAQLILECAVKGRVKLSQQQYDIVGQFGWPDTFSIMEVDDTDDKSLRYESWTYYAGQTRYEFVDGVFQTWGEVEPLPRDTIGTPYRPNQFALGASVNEVRVLVAGNEWMPMPGADLLIEGIADELKVYVAPQLVAGFSEGRLVFVEAMALVPDRGE